MTAGLDYDTLELLGAAIRESHRRCSKEPLPDELVALCERLEQADDYGSAAGQPATEDRAT